MNQNAKKLEIEKNFEAFQEMLPDLLTEHCDKYALMRHEKLIGMYSTAEDAVQTGELLYKDRLFSVQTITDVPVDLGFFSHVAYLG